MKAVILDLGYESYEQETQAFGEAGHTLDFFRGDRFDIEGRLGLARDAEGILVRWSEIGPEQMDALPRLRYIVRYGVGYDNIDIPAATQRGILVANVQGYASQSVSDHALALIFAAARSLKRAPEYMFRVFSAPPIRDMPDFRELDLGIIGLGRIGSTLSRKAGGLFRGVYACDPYIPAGRFDEAGAIRLELAELLERCRVISLHCNLTAETRHLMNAAAFERMQPGSVLANTARGPVVDEAALLAALDQGIVRGAGIDVFEDEPPAAGNPLLSHPAVVVSGHYAWYSSQAHEELQRRAAGNMLTFLRGELPEDCLNPDAYKGAGSADST